jgi:hypothetical protein
MMCPQSTPVLKHIVTFCSEPTSAKSVHIVGTGLSILANVSYAGGLDLVVNSGAPALCESHPAYPAAELACATLTKTSAMPLPDVQLLCNPTSPAAVVGYAAGALGNLTADSYGAASVAHTDRNLVLVRPLHAATLRA